MKVIAVTQVRYSSSRLPAKVLLKPDGVRSLLEMHLERIRSSKRISDLIVALADEPGAEHIESILIKTGVKYVKGSVSNVLDRFYKSVVDMKPDLVVRLTSDCPLISPVLIDEIILKAQSGKYDYVSNTLHPTYPDGMDVEVFTFSAMERAWKEAKLKSELEHVTPFIIKNADVNGGSFFKAFSFEGDTDYSQYRLTVDEQRDFELIKALVERIGAHKDWLSYVQLLQENPQLYTMNSSIIRNEGYSKSLKNDHDDESNKK